MIDCHAHLNDEKLKNNICEINNSSLNVGVNKIINVGYDLQSSIDAVKIASEYENMYAVVGVHPHDAKNYSSEVEQKLENLTKNKKVVAIGEIGLDYHYDLSPRDVQKDVFIKQIILSHKLNLPIVIHTREAIGETLDILNEHKQLLTNGVLIHCFNASLEVLDIVIKNGWYVSFGGAITFKNGNKIVECVKNCPLDRIMLETDCPYMTPEPYRGQINTPVNLPIVAAKIAEIKQIDLKEVENVTEQNTIKFFNL